MKKEKKWVYILVKWRYCPCWFLIVWLLVLGSTEGFFGLIYGWRGEGEEGAERGK